MIVMMMMMKIVVESPQSKVNDMSANHSVNCAFCQKFGYADEYSKTQEGDYICARCSNPQINWAIFDTRGEINAIHKKD